MSLRILWNVHGWKTCRTFDGVTTRPRGTARVGVKEKPRARCKVPGLTLPKWPPNSVRFGGRLHQDRRDLIAYAERKCADIDAAAPCRGAGEWVHVNEGRLRRAATQNTGAAHRRVLTGDSRGTHDAQKRWRDENRGLGLGGAAGFRGHLAHDGYDVT